MFCTVLCTDPARALGIVDAAHVIMGRILEEEKPVEPGDDFYMWPFSLTPQGHLVFMAEKIRGPHRSAARILQQIGVRDAIEFCDSDPGGTVFERKALEKGWQARRKQVRDEIVERFLTPL